MTEWRRVDAIGRTEFRRQWRAVQEDTTQLITFVILAIFLVPMAFAGLIGAFFFGSQLASGHLETPITWGRLVLIYAWVLVAGFGGYRAYSTTLRPDRLDGMLTTVSHRELLGGIVYSDLLLWGGPAAAFSVLASLAFAAGARSLLAAPLSFLALALAFATALTTGYLLALAVRNTGVRSKLLTRLRTLFVVLLGVAYFGVIVTQNFVAVLEPIFWLLESTPVGWYGDLALIGTTAEVSVARAGGAVLASAAFLVVGPAALVRLVEWLWYADGVSVEHEVSSTAESTGTGESRLETVFPRSVVGVVVADWKRAKRAPIALSFVLYPLIFLLNPVLSVIQTGTVGSSFPLWIALTSAWITGVLFTLNVIGNEGAVLPATLTCPAPGRALVAGHALAGALLIGPVAVPLTVGLGVLSPHGLATTGSLAVGVFVLIVCAGPIATGIGALFPRFEAISVSRSTKAIVPSTLAFGVYSVLIALVSIPLLLGHSSLVGGAIASTLEQPRLVVAVTGTIVTGLLAVPIALLSARYAIRSVDTYHLE
ncbi:hypothetical protein [Natrarchaeobius chitinivorans]|uniref:Uncharacterized protein n=1 Tax=Natrarchaeobius chitinivorans TaxID=1679083 RepID=A0A3N6M1Y4_NATCH|nr:hypothetical protein [Natrarchaeobius chitinivorans]RQG97333.1 hypothetical protein EA473_03585 [Natrarchaeobius chitinivorans]